MPEPKQTPESGAERFEPAVFGKYFLLQRIGIGGMADVVRAKTLGAGGFQKELVVKRVLPKFAKNPRFVRMFVNEAKIAVGLSHSNIAQILELGQIDGTYFMAMELVEGVQLRELAPLFADDKSTLSVDHAVWTVIEVLKGLDHAHRQTDTLGQPLGLVHCDISPDNVMVTFDAAVKVLDFGIARAGTEISNHTEGVVMGKVNFLSPEQAVGRDVDARTDIYATGVLLYHLVTGDYPYGRAERLEDLVPLVSGKADYEPASALNPQVTPELDSILERAVALRPEDRYPDGRSFLIALEEVLYPTPHTAVADHLRSEIGRQFAFHRDRLTRLRANDATVMRILMRRTDQTPPQPQELPVMEAPPEPAPRNTTRQSAVVQGGVVAAPEPPWWRLSALQLVVAALLAAVGIGAVIGVQLLIPSDALVVTSDPPGARVLLDGEPLDGVTPLAVERIRTSQALPLRLERAGHRPWEGVTAGRGERVELINVRLRASRGAVRVESTPRAVVLLDGEEKGRTPVVLRDLDLTVPHKIGLQRRGYELDELIIQDVDDGHLVRRTLERRRRAR